jgi:hypothetical protein
MQKLVRWLDEHGMFSIALFLLIFIPIYPKLPLLEAIPGYLVRVRLEDILVALAGGFWLVQALRKKVRVPWPVLVLVIGYALAGLLTLVVGVGLQQTIPSQLLHIGKSGLHYGRYLEYFSLFFFLYSGIKTKLHTRIALASLVACVTFITVYGFGQRYWQWPVFSTMNREFSKGEALTLSEAARVHSTFGGHYDLAAYLVIVLPILFALVLKAPDKKVKIASMIISIGGVWLLYASAQKTSLIAFVASVAVLWFYFLYNRFGWKKTILYTTGAGVAGVLVLGVFFATIGNKYAQKITGLVAGNSSDLPQDVMAGPLDETWSENARKYGLSMGIRLDTLWPQALRGFSINPWTGKGYATLNKQGTNEFTEADSTDNNYLRSLGETGLLGSSIFFGIVWFVFNQINRTKTKDIYAQVLQIGYAAGTTGLLVNALIIDVFSASKVAFSFWAITGLVMATTQLGQEKTVSTQDRQILQSWLTNAQKALPIIATLVIFILFAHKRPFSEYSPVQGFSFDQTSAVNAHAARCLANQGPACENVLASIPAYNYPYIGYLTPWYKLLNHPSVFYLANLLAAVTGLLLIHVALRKKGLPNSIQFIVLLAIATPFTIGQLVSIASPTSFWLLVSGILVWLISSSLVANKLIANLKQATVFRSSHIPAASGIFALVLLAITAWQLPVATTIPHNFRDGYDVHHYRAVRRLNGFAKGISSQQQPFEFLTFLDPHYVALFNDNAYSVQPVPNETNYSNYKQQLTSGKLFYFSNAARELENTASLASTLALTKQFGLQLETIDCEHRCNIFRVLPEKLPLPTKVQTANGVDFQQQDTYKLVIAPNKIARFFNPTNNFTATTNFYKNALEELQPDAFVFTGISTDKVEDNHGSFFRTRFIDEQKVPVIYAIGDNSPSVYSSYGPIHQRFVLKNTMVVMLDDTVSDSPQAQQRFIFDTLLQVHQHSEITDLIIISNSLNWTKGLNEHDQHMLSAYTNVTNLKWHLISGQTEAAELPHAVLSNINDATTYIGMDTQREPVDLVWTLTITQNGVEVSPHLFSNAQNELVLDQHLEVINSL